MRYTVLLVVVLAAVVQSQEDDVEMKPVKGKMMKPINRGDNFFLGGPMMRGRQMGRFGKGRMPMPPFLEGASDETKAAVREVLMKPDTPREEMDGLIEQILKNDRPEVMDAFNRFKEEMESRRAEREKEHTEQRERLSEGARQADIRLMEIFQDQSLSPSDRRNQMKKVFETLSDTIKQELRSLRKNKKTDRVAMKIREIGEEVRNVHQSLQDALRSAFGGPMRRLKFPQPPQPSGQLETKSIKLSEDGEFIEF